MSHFEGKAPPEVVAIARATASEAIASGADAVVLTGSYAKGQPLPYADIDLVAIGEGRDAIEQREGFLVTVAWCTKDAVLRSFEDPPSVGTVVPGWRDAIVLADSSGVASSLQQRARRWSWEGIAHACDRYVTAQVTGYAEEVHKLAGALSIGNRTVAAVQRDILALRLAGIMAVHRRLLYGSENVLWDLVADAEAEPWRTAQHCALGLDACGFEPGCRAALELYRLLAEATWHLLDEPQRPVVEAALALIV